MSRLTSDRLWADDPAADASKSGARLGLLDAPESHPRTIGALGAAALAMGGANRSLLLIGVLLAAQGSAAIPLLAAGLLLSMAALPGWTELVLLSPRRVGGIAAACAEAFRPYSPVLANLTGICYWWGWLPTCGLTALISAGVLHSWYLPDVPVHLLAAGIVLVLAGVNLMGLRRAARLAVPLAVISGGLAALSALIPVLSGHFDVHRALDFRLTTPFSGTFGAVTGAMAGLYLIGSAAPAFEAALTHVGEMRDPRRTVPKAMAGAAAMAAVYFLVLPAVWLGTVGAIPLQGDLSHALGPMFAPLLGGGAKAAAVTFVVLSLFSGTLQPLAGSARTLFQLAEDGLLPVSWTRRNRHDVPWVTTMLTAGMAILFLASGNPTWVLAAANLAYLIGIGMPSVAVWLLRRNEPRRDRPFRAPRGTIAAGLLATGGWLAAVILGFEQFGLPTVMASVGLCYSGCALYVWRRSRDHGAVGTNFRPFSLRGKLTAAMITITALDGTGYLVAVSHVQRDNPALVTMLQDIFLGISLLTIAVGLVLPGLVGHAVEQVARAARRLSTGTLAELTRSMQAIGEGDLDAPPIPTPVLPVEVRTKDELGEMATAFNLMQEQAGHATAALETARLGLLDSRETLARQAGQQAAVARLGLKALQTDSPKEVRHDILESARELLGADEVSIYEWVHAAGTIRRAASVGSLATPQAVGAVEADDPLLRVSSEHRLSVTDWEAEPPTLSCGLRAAGVRATLAVQISELDGASGLLAAHFRTPREFGQDESDTLQALANLLAGTSQRERAAEEMLWRALHDPLTGLPNRLLFIDRLRQAVAGCARTGRSVAVLFLDLDHFKFVNDSLGHSTGDELLRQIADRLRLAMRARDTVARFGGDEFLLICENLDSPEESEEIAERAIEVLSEPLMLAGQEHVVTGSLGIAVATDAGRHPEDLVREADAAMYEAKESGRNSWAVYDEVMRARASSRLTIESQLRRALDCGELRLSYQPVVSLPHRRIDGFEALVRWQHPERGLILPEEFMPVAEQSGLIIPIGRWVLREAVKQAALWQRTRNRHLPVAVNLSAREVTRRDLSDLVSELLNEHELDPALLELEITESVLIEPAEASVAGLSTLRERGVRIVLDDFGTGYSSLAYVKNFPIDGLKIDRSFVRDMAAASADASIVEAVIAMARGLRLGVVAEGVETIEQADLLEDMGCVRCQGFMFARALPAAQIERLLEDAPVPA